MLYSLIQDLQNKKNELDRLDPYAELVRVTRPIVNL